jgi:hypothetical protein
MPRVSVPLSCFDQASRVQLEYAITFASEDIVAISIDEGRGCIDVEVTESTDQAAVVGKIKLLIL